MKHGQVETGARDPRKPALPPKPGRRVMVVEAGEGVPTMVTPASGWRADASSWPLVTAVVLTMNRQQLLIRAVQSVIDQDYPGDIECLVVYDGTEPVIPDVRLRDGRFRCW